MEAGRRINDSMSAFYSMVQSLGLILHGISPSPTIVSPIFVSLDLEYNTKNITQLGVSIFDTESLRIPNLENLITNEYPIISTLYSTTVNKFRQRRRKPSHFGAQCTLDLVQLRPLPTQILGPTDEKGCQRNVILVGHMLIADLKTIKLSCGLDISQLQSIRAILDTQHVSHHILTTPNRLSLKHLLHALNLDYVGLHNAAHDSRYTLRALLAMFCESQQSVPSELSTIVVQRFSLMKQIAQFHTPRKPILWCENSPRVKNDMTSDLLEIDDDDDDLEHGVLEGLF